MSCAWNAALASVKQMQRIAASQWRTSMHWSTSKMLYAILNAHAYFQQRELLARYFVHRHSCTRLSSAPMTKFVIQCNSIQLHKHAHSHNFIWRTWVNISKNVYLRQSEQLHHSVWLKWKFATYRQTNKKRPQILRLTIPIKCLRVCASECEVPTSIL